MTVWVLAEAGAEVCDTGGWGLEEIIADCTDFVVPEAVVHGTVVYTTPFEVPVIIGGATVVLLSAARELGAAPPAGGVATKWIPATAALRPFVTLQSDTLNPALLDSLGTPLTVNPSG